MRVLGASIRDLINRAITIEAIVVHDLGLQVFKKDIHNSVHINRKVSLVGPFIQYYKF